MTISFRLEIVPKEVANANVDRSIFHLYAMIVASVTTVTQNAVLVIVTSTEHGAKFVK